MSHRDPETGWRAPLLLGDQRALPSVVTQTESPQAGQEGEGLSSKKEACSVSMNLPLFSWTGAWEVGGKNTENGVKMGEGSHHPAPLPLQPEHHSPPQSLQENQSHFEAVEVMLDLKSVPEMKSQP